MSFGFVILSPWLLTTDVIFFFWFLFSKLSKYLLFLSPCSYQRTLLHTIVLHVLIPAILESLNFTRSSSVFRTFAPKSSYGEIFFISPLKLVHKVLTPKMKKKLGVTDFGSEKMAVEKCLNFDKSVIITRCSLSANRSKILKKKRENWGFRACIGFKGWDFNMISCR